MCELNIIQRSLLNALNRDHFFSIGDSHAFFYQTLDYVSVKHLGPVTCYNLTKENSTTRGREKLFQILNYTNAQKTAIILSFGEIDLRVHVVKSAIKDSITIEDSVNRTVNEYTKVIQNLHDFGWKVLIHGPSASGEDKALNLDFPYSGSMQDRNYATIIFNQKLKEFCDDLKIPFSSLYDLSIDKNTLTTKSEFLSDGCHLKINPVFQGIILSRFISGNFNFINI